jgi:hypothetical protein
MYIFDVDSIKFGGGATPSQVIIFANISQSPNTIFGTGSGKQGEYKEALSEDIKKLEGMIPLPFTME